MALGDFNLSNGLVRWGPQAEVGIPATLMEFQAGMVSSSLAMTPGQIPNPELSTGSQTAPPVRGSVTVGGDLNLTLRVSDAQTLLAQIQGAADITALSPATDPAAPTGAFHLELAPDKTTDQKVPLTFEMWNDDLNGGQIFFDCWVANAVFTWAEQSLVTAVLTISGGKTSYWGDAVARGTGDASASVYVLGYPKARRRERNRPGTSGDMTLEIVDEESPGVWNARAALGRIEVLDLVNTLAASTSVASSTPGSVDFREILFPGDWVAFFDTVATAAVEFEVDTVAETSFELVLPFPSAFSGIEVMRAFGDASVTFPLRSGESAEGRPLFDEALSSHDGLLFGDNVLRTLATTAGTDFEAGDSLPLVSTATCAPSANLWTGVVSDWATSLEAGMTVLDDAGDPYVIAEVVNDTSMRMMRKHVAGFSGVAITARRQWTIARERPEFARVIADEGPLSEIFATFLFGDLGEEVNVEVETFALTHTPPRPAQTRVGSPWPGTVTESGVRALGVSASVVYGPETQTLHNLLELSADVAMVITTENGQPVISPVPIGEEAVAAVETRMVLVAVNMQNVDSPRQVNPGAGRNLFPVNATLHPSLAAPDLTIELITASDALLVDPAP